MLLFIPGARAQVVNDSATRMMLNETNIIPGDVTIGTNGSFTLLTISDNALLTNSAQGVIGRNSNAKSNEVRLVSSTAIWRMGGSLQVGFDGAANQLTVSNGGVVQAKAGDVGLTPTGSNNVVMVTGSGSLWSNANELVLGFGSAGNQLVVSNGGVVRNTVGYVGNDAWSSNTVAVVTDPSSLWTNGSTLNVGYSGASGNQLRVSNGGRVVNSNGIMSFSATSRSNSAVLTGSGSIWDNLGSLIVGNSGSGNVLIASNGATVRAGIGQIGFNSSSSSNLALVTGAGSQWTNLYELYVGQSGSGNQLVVSYGAQVRNNTGFIGNGASAKDNLAVVTDPGTIWNNTLHTFVGFDGRANHLIITNGGLVTNGLDALIGANSFADKNTAMLSGLGSRWVINRSFELGHSGDENELLIENGASLVSGKATIGVVSTSDHNLAAVSGPGATWTNLSILEVGAAGFQNTLLITDGAGVVSSNGTIGALASASGNVAEIIGSNSRWLMGGDLYVGSNGPASVFGLGGGGSVVNDNGIIGFGVSSSSNLALITGTGSVWSNRQALIIGESGNGNQLQVSDGARVVSKDATLGDSVSASNNVVVVTDPGSFWTTEEHGDMTVGQGGGGNRLVITNGAWVRGGGEIGSGGSTTDNEVVVTGAGSSWTNLNGLAVGNAGSRNRLVITNGGSVTGTPANIGSDSRGSNNLVVVTGAGSSWNIATELSIGNDGAANRLVVSNSGAVFAGSAVYLGLNSSSTNNQLTVDGGALRATNAAGTGALDVRRGTNVFNAGLIDVNQLLLTNTLGKFEFNGGMLVTRGAVISNGVPFLIGGTGSTPAVWDVRAGAASHAIASYVAVGDTTSFNRLLITNGALLTAPDGGIGNASGSHSNQVIVSGLSSRLETLGDLYVGNFGSANSLVISNGGSVSAVIPVIGFDFSSGNNQAVVTGSGSLWTIRDSLEVGQRGAANLALIADGGAVIVSNTVTVGSILATSSNNLVHVLGGVLLVTNGAATGTLDVRRGTNRLDAGLIHVDRLLLTNTLGVFEFNGGKLSSGNSTVNNGRTFFVGSGSSAATLQLQGGAHVFANQLFIGNNAFLVGNGTVIGTLIVAGGGNLSPSAGGRAPALGKMVLSNSPVLSGAVIMEISKSGSVLTNDEIQVTGTLTYGGALTVSNIGPTALTTSNRFKLFSAGVFAGSFAPISLPPLNAGLNWTNKLLVDGSIEVVGAAQPKFTSVSRSGTNVIISGTGGPANAPYAVLTATNLTTPSSNWVSLVTNQFDAGGGFSFSNGIVPGEPSRFFRIRTP